MQGDAETAEQRRGSRLRRTAWASVALVLLLPWVAMRFTEEVAWEPADFVLAGALLLAVGVPLELAVRRTGDRAYRAALAVALVGAFLLLWVNGAVGIIGSEDNDANLMLGGVLAVGLVGSVVARFRPRGMARALVATALAHASVAVIAMFGGLGSPSSGPPEIVYLNGIFIALWVGSALLFREAAVKHHEKGACDTHARYV